MQENLRPTCKSGDMHGVNLLIYPQLSRRNFDKCSLFSLAAI